MEKPTKRKAFNFLRSYFDVLNELENDADKLAFLLSIINKQFLDQDPKDLNFIVNLCYQSQKHAIETSVKGWKRAYKEELADTPKVDPPTDPPTPKGFTPSTDPKEEEEEEKEEVQDKEKEEINNVADESATMALPSTSLNNLPKKEKEKKVAPKKEIKPSKEEFLQYARDKALEVGYSLDEAKTMLKYDSWKEAGWKTGGKSPRKIVNWKSTLTNSLQYLKRDSSERISVIDMLKDEKPFG